MSQSRMPVAVLACKVAPRAKQTNYPEPFATKMQGREKRVLGDIFDLTNFGVNYTRLAPNAISALRHAHSKQDEFIFIVSGAPTLITDEGETPLVAGMCAGFKAGNGNAHQLVNKTSEDVIYIEIGDRSSQDQATYPDDDLEATLVDGQWHFCRKDGSAY